MIARTVWGRVLYAWAVIQPTRLLRGVHVSHGFSIVFLIAALPVCDTKAFSIQHVHFRRSSRDGSVHEGVRAGMVS